MGRYRHPAIEKLKEQQVRYAPNNVRSKQMDRAEELVRSIDAETSYSYPELCQQLTDYKPKTYPDLKIEGPDALHDLRCLIEDLSDSMNLDAEQAHEEVLTVQDVSREYNVSTKTVDRWREKGLVSRKFRFGNRKRVGFLRSSVESFVSAHKDDVDRGRQFSQISEEQREDIVRRARRLARHGACISDVSRRLAKKLNRSVETIRYTLKKYDQDHPQTAVFPNASQPLTDDARREIYRRFTRSTPVEKLAAKYGRTRSSIYRIVNEVRSQHIAEASLDYMDSEEFHQPDAERVILGPPPEASTAKPRVKAPPGLPPYLASLYEVPLLNREQEAYYFRKMNYLKFRASELRATLDENRPRPKLMDEIERYINEAGETKNFLIRSNLRLVVSIAKRHISPTGNFFEMVSDGNMSLIRAIEKFDYTKGNKFSTYASWAIMKNFARSIPAENVLQDRFRTGNDELFSQRRETRANNFQAEINHEQQHDAVMSIIGRLDDREQAIIRQRFGLERGSEPLTLEQVGSRLGVTKERIRQLEKRALKKLQKFAAEEKLEVPGI